METKGEVQVRQWLRDARKGLLPGTRRMSQPAVDAATRALHPSARVSQSYLSQLEAGAKPLGSLDPLRAEALRRTYGLDLETWERGTGVDLSRASLELDGLIARPPLTGPGARPGRRSKRGTAVEWLAEALQVAFVDTEFAKRAKAPVRLLAATAGAGRDDATVKLDIRALGFGVHNELLAHRVERPTVRRIAVGQVVVVEAGGPPRRGEVVLAEWSGLRFLGYAADAEGSLVKVLEPLEPGGSVLVPVDVLHGRFRGVLVHDPREYDAPEGLL